MIRLQGLRTTLGAFTLGPIDLDAPAGAYVALVGPSGHGKSSLLWTLAGAIDSQGLIQIGDLDVSALPSNERRVGLAPQGAQLFPHLTVAANIAYGARGSLQLKTLAETWGVAQLLDRRAPTLSGGEAMRVSIARALARDPALLLLDEPLGSIDEAGRAPLLANLRALRGTRTVIHVTHDLDEAASLATHLGVMRDGKLVAFGTAEDVLLRPTSVDVAQFLGVENVLAGNFTPHGEDACLFRTGELELHVLARANGPGYVSVPERAVMISLETPQHVSARNAIPASVVGVTFDRAGARVELAGAVKLFARLERESVTSLGLEPGKRVVAVVKSAQLRVVGQA
ncbi:MAG: ABC transporter ATP-binding protein [Deltaproteobacteria bacterium]|nr:ABC transporter ATP-binding protein [Deltaproteobacteria bacterium]